jgi:hypothetical protein
MSSGSSLPPDSIASPLPPARTIAAWRVLLRAAGVLLALFTVCFWAAKGYHRGWTKNQVRMDQVDEVTGIVYPTYVDRFVPGIDYLGGGIFAGAVLFAATLLPARGRRKS